MDMVGFGFIIPLLPDYIRMFGGHEGLVGFLMSAYAAGQFFAAPVVGRLSDRYGRKPLLLFSIGGTMLALLLLGFAQSLLVLFASRIVDGLTGGNVTVAQSYIADVTDEENRARGLGFIGAAFGLGFIFGPVFGGLLVTFGLQVPAFAAAGIAALNLLLIAFVLPESLTAAQRKEGVSSSRRAFSLRPLIEALGTRKLGSVLHVMLFHTFAFYMFENLFSVFARQQLGLSAQSRSFLLAYVGVLVALVQGGGIGILTKRFKETTLSAVAAAVLSVSLLLWAFTPDLLYLVVVLIPLSVSAGVLATVLRSLLSKSVPPEETGGTMGISTSLESFNRIVAPAIGGVLFGTVGSWAPGVLGGVFLAWVAFFVWRRMGHTNMFAGAKHAEAT